MKDNRFDKILDEVVRRVERVTDKISRGYENVKPFDTEKIKPYSKWSPDYALYLRSVLGDEAVDAKIAEEEAKRGYYA